MCMIKAGHCAMCNFVSYNSDEYGDNLFLSCNCNNSPKYGDFVLSDSCCEFYSYSTDSIVELDFRYVLLIKEIAESLGMSTDEYINTLLFDTFGPNPPDINSKNKALWNWIVRNEGCIYPTKIHS